MTSPPALATRGFHHITLVSTDAARTLEFYRDLLGMELVKRTVNFDDPSAWHLYLGAEPGDPEGPGAPGTILTFFEWPRSRRGQWGVGGVHHLALGVDDEEAQLKWKRRLEDAGVRVTGPLDRGYFTSLYFADPDGQILEIATLGPGYAIDEPADALGRSEVVPPTERLPEGRNEVAIEARSWPEPVPSVTEEMRLRGIHHVSAITDDLERSHDFLSEALGLRLVKKTLNQDDGATRHWFWAHYDGESVGDHSAFTLFGWPGSTLAARPGAGQTHHVAFRARDEEEQRAWQDHLRSLDLEVTDVLDRSYFRSIYFQAPDGLLLEIATDGPGFAVDEPADSLGTRLKLPPWLEGERDSVEAGLSSLESRPTTGGPVR